MAACEVVIVGGGVIGLASAWTLARAGARVTILDQREIGREASWSGAGMIPAYRRIATTSPLAHLRSWSACLHAEWSERLREETGIDNGYRRNGGVDLAADAREAEDLRAAAEIWRAEGVAFEHLDAADFCHIEPLLAPNLFSGWFLPDRAQIRNPWHLDALLVAVERAGVRVEPHRGARGFETRDGRVLAVRTEHGPIACGAVVVASGAWSGDLLGRAGVAIAVAPVKGQIALLRSTRPRLSRIVEHGRHYLVPRDDGRILVGATEEHTGFDAKTTALGVRGLLDAALRVCPALAAADFVRAWAGLRPGSADDRPYIGRAPGFENLFVAAGHGRAGQQLSTGTAKVVADLVLDRTPPISLASFAIDRPQTVAHDPHPAFRS